jgi:hypothetical protein
MQARTVSAELEKQLEALRHTLQSATVRLEHPEEIHAYLRQHPDLTPVVAHAAKQARDAFPDATLLLQLYHDPEIEEDTFLTLWIRPVYYEPSVYERIEALEERLMPEMKQSSGLFILNTDFQQVDTCQP